MACKVTLLTGAAGTGKTHRCVSEVVEELKAAPVGKPLVFLLPRQSTFQIEQAVYGKEVRGSTRLQIVSFERLTGFLLKLLGTDTQTILDNESSVMLIQAILCKHSQELLRYSAYTYDTGLAREISSILAKFQQQQKSPESVMALAQALLKQEANKRFASKLHDIALIYDEYLKWIKSRQLLNEEASLEQVTKAIKDWHQSHPDLILIERIWLDGFSELTPQELDFLKSISSVCRSMTLAFCLDSQKEDDRSFWKHTLSPFQKCRDCFKEGTSCEVEVVCLPRQKGQGRFGKSEPLAYLERYWFSRNRDPQASRPLAGSDIEVCVCPEISDEAIFAARKITEFVRSGGRYRDCFVAFRDMGEYESTFRRVFRHYEIPFFLDISQSITHHPLSELTLQMLRVVAAGWKQDDVFSLLKTELAGLKLSQVDWLENEFLKHNYSGMEFWKSEPWNQWESEKRAKIFENAKKESISILLEFNETLSKSREISGKELGSAIRKVWEDYHVQEQLEEWSSPSDNDENFSVESGLSLRIHSTVWERINRWLDNLCLAFDEETFPLQRWIEIVEAGLGELSVSAIPPSVDQVVLGNIDRSRSPAVCLMIIPGMNDTVFPAYRDEQTLFSRDEQELLLEKKILDIFPRTSEKTSRENYLSYIAVSRPSVKLIVTYAQEDRSGSKMNPSHYVGMLCNLFHDLDVKPFSLADISLENCISMNEVPNLLSRYQGKDEALRDMLKLVGCPENILSASLVTYQDQTSIPSDVMKAFFKGELALSVSKLESYSKCPFRFFATSIVRGKERDRWDIGVDKLGSLTHKALEIFHKKVLGKGSSWREELSQHPYHKLVHESVIAASKEIFVEDENATFTDMGGSSQLVNTEEKINLYLDQMRDYFSTYKFDPTLTELEFGKDKSLSWKIKVGSNDVYMQGRIDRLDVYDDQKGNLWLAVIDYKSGETQFKQKDFNAGIQIQLIAYLCAIQHTELLELLRPHFKQSKADTLKVAGAFYLCLKRPISVGEKSDANFKHYGRFDNSLLRDSSAFLDSLKPLDESKQFSAKLNKDGSFAANKHDPIYKKELQDIIQQTEKIIKVLAKRILDGEFPVQPCGASGKSPCQYCPVQGVCRFDLRREKVSKLVPILSQESTLGK